MCWKSIWAVGPEAEYCDTIRPAVSIPAIMALTQSDFENNLHLNFDMTCRSFHDLYGRPVASQTPVLAPRQILLQEKNISPLQPA